MKYEIFLLYFLLYFKIHIYKDNNICATTHGLLLLFSETNCSSVRERILLHNCKSYLNNFEIIA